MKTYLLFIVILFNSFLLFAAQERSTTGMKIILVVGAKTNKITTIAPLDTFQKMIVSEVFEKYPGCHFYIGHLKGNYDLIDRNVVPSENAMITMYTEREFFKYGNFKGAENLGEGDGFILGKVMSEVTSNKKGELCFKVNKP